MKRQAFLAVVVMGAVLLPNLQTPAQALSCLPVDMYLKEVVGDENIVIFVGEAIKQMEEDGYTAEVVKVTEAKQGYVEEEIFVYHEKDETWGYLCNNGPKKVGDVGVYVAARSDLGTYNVHQRLEIGEDAAKTLDTLLEEEEVAVGEVVGLTATDRMNQIMTTILDLFGQITKLLKEYAYWKGQ